ncbi:hypothetical protein HanIR_Chr17g0865511 [Helianthus annuus]|nr:hypothetical protein HanIR_Chr17g0865511 [Helianthus annuus]
MAPETQTTVPPTFPSILSQWARSREKEREKGVGVGLFFFFMFYLLVRAFWSFHTHLTPKVNPIRARDYPRTKLQKLWTIAVILES